MNIQPTEWRLYCSLIQSLHLNETFGHCSIINAMLASDVPIYDSIYNTFRDKVHGAHWHTAFKKKKSDFAELGVWGELRPMSELQK